MSGSDLTNKLVAAGLAWLPASLLGEAVGTAISVLDYGALGDGVHDDTAAIQKAATAVGQAGGTLLFPPGTYLVSSPIAISSDTLVQGSGAGSILTTAAVWHDPGIYGTDPYIIFVNKNYGASPIVDTNIVIENLSFVWTNATGAILAHNIRIYAAKNITVRGCIFTAGGDGVAGIGVQNMLVDGCSAYNFTNCSYDFWGGFTNVRVVNCYAETGSTAQMVNFNAHISGASSPLVSDGFVLANCELKYTGAGNNRAILTSTLATTDIVKNGVIASNKLDGVIIVGSGNQQCIAVTGNVIVGTQTNSSIGIFGDGVASNPDGITVVGNCIINPQTVAGSLGVIRVDGTDFTVTGNVVTGSSYYAACSCSSNVGIVCGNSWDGNIAGSPFGITGTAWQSTTSDFVLANNLALGWRANAGGEIKWILQSDNHIYYSVDNTGAQQFVFSYQGGTSASPFRIGPTTQLAVSSANYIRAQGGATGVAPGSAPSLGIDANATDADVALRVFGKGTLGALLQAHTITGPPTTTNIPSGFFTVAPDGSGNFKLYYNAAGTLKSVALA